MDKENIPEQLVFGLDIGTRSIVGTVGYKQSVNNFVVVAQSVRCHETRAMMDGQIHDIAKVAETISQVRRELEHQIGRKLNRVCIAAAGRVLKTVTVEVEENLGDENFQDEMISAEIIHGLEMLGVEKAYEIIRKETQGENIRFYCVGYSVVHYYLNDNMITNLEGHKGNKIAAKVLATFLPQEVIDGLYASTEKAGLEVDNLTLEPIAAINVAIPEKFRPLNIALVDVGAGTSDICITKEGTVVAYGMIPMAGDAITNVIVQAHLVDFATAEEIKIGASMQKKVINYKDIMGLAEKTTPEEVFAETQDKVAEITQLVADKIVELNGGKSVSAVFVVGGGGKLPDFVKMLANRLNLPEERVALRGEEVLGAITFPEDVKKDPMLVTPIGICLNYYEQKNNFIFVQVNGERVKLYDNSKLTIVDAALSVGFPNDGLFPKRGMALEFFVNERKRMVRGGEGEAAVILLNGRTAGINTPIEANDIIEITASTAGEAAHMMIGELAEYKKSIEFLVNGKRIICPKFVRANGQLVSEYYDIHADDQLEIQDYYTLRQLLDFMDVMYQDGILVNHVPAGEEEKIYDKFSVDFDFSSGAKRAESTAPENHVSSDLTLSVGKEQEGALERDFSFSDEEASSREQDFSKENLTKEISDKEVSLPETSAGQSTTQGISVRESGPQEADTDLRINVNATPVVLKGKTEYRVVDILDFYDFDVKTAHGNRVVIKVNGTPCNFSTKLSRGDYVELYWED